MTSPKHNAPSSLGIPSPPHRDARLDGPCNSPSSSETERARDLLTTAVRAVERVGVGSERALREEPWRGLSGHWTLLGQFESDGHRYAVARHNDAPSRGVPALSPREREALSLGAQGRTNKQIASEMALSVSTIRVLLHRAAKKLGTDTREALVATFRSSTGASTD